MKAVVMAGGFGTRIQPLTSSVPKPMIPVFNKPMMEYIILSLKNAGIRDIAILLYFKPEVIKEYFGDGSKLGLNIQYFTPDDDYGTAGAVKKAEKFLDERFIVVSGDLVTDFNIPEIIGYHEFKQSKATITLTSVPDPLQFGVVITDGDGKIVRFLEKPGWGEVFSDTINTGIYVFEPEILNYIPENKNFDFSKDLFPSIMASGTPIYGFNAKGYWRDVGNPDSYRTSLLEIASGMVKLPFEGEKKEFPEGVLYHGKNFKMDKSSRISGVVVVGDDCVIEEECEVSDCSLGNGCSVGAKTNLSKSILWDGVTIGSDCGITNAVLCDNVRVGVRVKCDHGVIIAEGTKVGNGVVFEKDIMVWPDKQIEEGSIVSSNLIWGDKWKNAIFEGGKVSARTNIELSSEMAAKLGAAFGSLLPQGSKILTSRDYHKASRMLKRAFLGGLLSTGVNAVDLKMEALPAMRYKLSTFGEVGGVHFRQSPSDPTHTEILFFNESGESIDSGVEKNLERAFFRENFRRVTHNEIGDISEKQMVKEFYMEGLLRSLDQTTLKAKNSKIVLDLLNGVTDPILPKIFNKTGIDSVILNANHDEMKLSRSAHQQDMVIDQAANIVKVLNADAGFIIYPSGERIAVIDDKGEKLKGDKLLMLMLLLIDRSCDKKVRVYLPAFAPSVLDGKLKNIEIVHGKWTGLKSSFLRDFYFSGNLRSFFVFTEHSTTPDAMYSSLKIVEMINKIGRPLSDIVKDIPEYKYYHSVINCPVEMKGFLMRKMSEEARDKDASFLDGIKIILNSGWAHMVPDQYSPNVHLYIEGKSEKEGDKLHKEYVDKINKWIEEQEKEQ
ncbi:MAG: NTP transferase domain-containing protein [Mucispirillum sp.]|nr:NTP transferase domain-containing protein [Mucispirillum sp.]